jgi:hypothetical protein
MAAGLGFKDFTTGEVLTAADVDGYLMQGIWVFASTAARDAAVTSPSEGNFAFTKDTNSLWYYDGAAWVASGATGDIEGVTAGIGISGGGTSGTVTVTNSMATAIDAKGDLVAGTGADTFAKLTVGANGTVLTAASGEATGLQWATPASGGGMTLISTTTLSGSSITLSSIPQTYNNLFIVIKNLLPSASADPRYRFNGDSTANRHRWIQNSDALNTNFAFDGTGVDFGGSQNNSVAQNLVTITIPDYTNTTTWKMANLFGVFNAATNSAQLRYMFTYGFYNQTSAVTSLEIFLVSGSFTSGTVLLYGVK